MSIFSSGGGGGAACSPPGAAHPARVAWAERSSISLTLTTPRLRGGRCAWRGRCGRYEWPEVADGFATDGWQPVRDIVAYPQPSLCPWHPLIASRWPPAASDASWLGDKYLSLSRGMERRAAPAPHHPILCPDLALGVDLFAHGLRTPPLAREYMWRRRDRLLSTLRDSLPHASIPSSLWHLLLGSRAARDWLWNTPGRSSKAQEYPETIARARLLCAAV